LYPGNPATGGSQKSQRYEAMCSESAHRLFPHYMFATSHHHRDAPYFTPLLPCLENRLIIAGT
jgi:hypothetical protein